MNDDVYTRMMNRLNRFDRKMGNVPTAMELLRMIYVPEDAVFCAEFPEGALTVKELADLYKCPEQEIKARIEDLCHKNLIFTTVDEANEKRYELMPWLPGVLEMSVVSHKGTPWLERFNALYLQYGKEAAAKIESMGGIQKLVQSMPEPDVRTLALSVSLPVESTVYDYENLMDLIDKETCFAVSRCTCRTLSELRGVPCKHGLPEYSCLSFGKAARHGIEYGHSKQITKEDCKAIIEKSAKAGAIHNANNYTEALQYLCNCCPDCCAFFSRIKLMGNAKMITPSNFIPVLTGENCTGCGICVERCPVDAITLSDVSLTNEEACIGCGSCVAGCPSEARVMKRRSEYKPTLGNRKVGMGY